MKTVIKNFSVRNKTFRIVRNEDGFYCAIDTDYIDENGCLTKGLNGFEMNASRDLNQCLNCTRDKIEINYLISTGMDKATAFATYWKLDIDAVKKAFSELDKTK